MSAEKTDATSIIEFLDSLKNNPTIRKSDRYFWPSFIFHYTPIKAAKKILTDGRLKCRHSLELNDELTANIASKEILEKTEPEKKKFVRLYFRPRTPTQFHNEGIRPAHKLSRLKAHCPVPIFFLFDARKLLTLEKTRFTNGNFSSTCKVGNTASFLRELPFDKIYHTGPYDINLNREIKFHRCAEVLYPDELDLSTLQYIYCRSEAEKETLLSLLPSDIWSKWHAKIIVGRTRLFEAKWTFLEKVHLHKKQAVFQFSPDSELPGPFAVEMQLTDQNSGQKWTYNKKEFYTNSSSSSGFHVNLPENLNRYKIELFLDGNLCYCNSYEGKPLPF